MLNINKLVSGYGDMTVLHGVSLEVHQGEIVSVVGSNGAGKSTLLKTIIGAIKPSFGTVYYNNSDITGGFVFINAREGLTIVPEGRQIFGEMSVRDNLIMGGYCFSNDRKKNLEYVYSLFPKLAERQTQLAGTMSGGEQQMLAIGRGLMANPKLLLLDEPSLGLSPLFTDIVFEAIKEINKKGVTVLLVEQNVFKSLSISNRGYVIETGKVVIEGTSEELLNNSDIKKAFLGM